MNADEIIAQNPTITVRELQIELARQKKENRLIQQKNKALQQEIGRLNKQLQWFQNQTFGTSSEKRFFDPQEQLKLEGILGDEPESAEEPPNPQVTYQRGKAKKKRPEDCLSAEGLRFNDSVPITTIEVVPDELKGPDADQYEVIGHKTTHRIAQTPASYKVIAYNIPVLKRKDSQAIITTSAANSVIDRSMADVSFLAGMLVDKFVYHLPLYRQHQRIEGAGFKLSRATLTNLTKRSIELLQPIAHAQLLSILEGQTIAMDETPIKAARKASKVKGKAGTMKTGYFWPVYGDRDEVVFTYSSSRGRQHIEKTLEAFTKGTLLTDGYSAYSSYVKTTKTITHATCWSHGRRKFLGAEDLHTEEVEQALSFIRALYDQESDLQSKERSEDARRKHRLQNSKPIVDAFFEWCQQHSKRPDLLPKDPLRKAIHYMLNREHQLRVFLEDPAVPLDTNHLERTIRPIAVGRKNWLFCWTEVGAEHVGIIQSLVSTCKLHDINPYHYLVDVLQRVSIHPANKVHELIPRIWKEKFASNPMRSDLATGVYNGLG